MEENNKNQSSEEKIKEIEINVMDLLENGVEIETGQETHIIITTGPFTFSD